MQREPVQTNYPHIAVRSDGKLVMLPSQLKLLPILAWALGQKWTVDDLLKSYPALSASEAHALFTYYHDNKIDLDAHILAQDEHVSDFHEAHRTRHDALKERVFAVQRVGE